ncbi:hypothetical protein NQ318_020272 [Aromia moschata]|uniref:Alpha N-terminal protein methyltransferase 1 n=1 Tax=Aromia moschata TaxID=1265417 RepID=A0AAV8ZC92_9CUCU|nr:hypothetical protein NQ318_020272 [Aromia moschata]
MTTEIVKISDDAFYSDGANYWAEIPATVDGMLGGFGFISQTDIKGSKMLLKQLFNSKTPPGRKYALDCGAGIGRISKFLLTDLFDKVDLVEQNAAFLQQAKKYLVPKIEKVGEFYSVGLQNFQPEARKYDVIWVQWVIGHLTDGDLINFFISCRSGLKANGAIVVKENITSTDEVELDRQDSSVTRPVALLRKIFDKAGLECYRQSKQTNFPKELYSVYMFVLKPKQTDYICTNEPEVSDEDVQSKPENKDTRDSHSDDLENVYNVIKENENCNFQTLHDNTEVPHPED